MKRQRRQAVQPAARRRQTQLMQVFVAAMLLSVAAPGCYDEGSIGVARCEGLGAGCLADTLSLGEAPIGFAARAREVLAPTWKKPIRPAFTAQAQDGGLWLALGDPQHVVLRHMSADGEIGPETRIAAPGRLADIEKKPLIWAISAHDDGPVVSVEWQTNTIGDPSIGENLVFHTGNLTLPTRVPSCASGDGVFCVTRLALRSADGASLLTVANSELTEQTLDGKVRWTEPLPERHDVQAGTAVGAEGWALFVCGSELRSFMAGTIQGDFCGILRVERGGAQKLLVLPGASQKSSGWPRPSVAVGPVSEELVVWVEYASSVGPGDLRVLRIAGNELTGEQTIERQQFSDLPIRGTGVDAVGNAYVLTMTGTREELEARRGTPLLCRVPSDNIGSCFGLSDMPLELRVAKTGVVYGIYLDSIARFDLPS